MGDFSISDLRQEPRFSGEVADRIWRAWWRHKGYSLEVIAGWVAETLDGEGLPVTLVAHRDEFLGTASVIANDLDARPQYTPWVAAVWVDAPHRDRGIGSALVQAAVRAGHKLGCDPIYLGASEAASPFYEKLGWRRLEDGIAGLNVLCVSRA